MKKFLCRVSVMLDLRHLKFDDDATLDTAGNGFYFNGNLCILTFLQHYYAFWRNLWRTYAVVRNLRIRGACTCAEWYSRYRQYGTRSKSG